MAFPQCNWTLLILICTFSLSSINVIKFIETSAPYITALHPTVKDKTNFWEPKITSSPFRLEVLEFDMAAQRARLRESGTALLTLIGSIPCMNPLMSDEIWLFPERPVATSLRAPVGNLFSLGHTIVRREAIAHFKVDLIQASILNFAGCLLLHAGVLTFWVLISAFTWLQVNFWLWISIFFIFLTTIRVFLIEGLPEVICRFDLQFKILPIILCGIFNGEAPHGGTWLTGYIEHQWRVLELVTHSAWLGGPFSAHLCELIIFLCIQFKPAFPTDFILFLMFGRHIIIAF